MTGRRVLVVEDVEINRKLNEALLVGRGFVVDAVATGREAVAMAKENDYAVVLMDIHLPDIDGTTAARLIRESADTSRCEVPILALSADAEDEDVSRYFDAGMDGVLPKPLRMEAFLQALDRVERRNADIAVSVADVHEEEALDEVLLSERLESLGRERFVDILALAREAVHEIVTVLDTVQEEANPEDVRRMGHKLAGAAANFGFVALSHAGHAIEMACDEGRSNHALTIAGTVRRLHSEVETSLTAWMRRHGLD